MASVAHICSAGGFISMSKYGSRVNPAGLNELELDLCLLLAT